MRLIFRKSFEKQYRKLPKKIKMKVKERNTLFEKEPFNPILNNHALHGKKFVGMRSIDITGDYRAIFITDKDNTVFVLIGTHSELYS